MSNNFTLAGMYLLCKCERPELLPFRANPTDAGLDLKSKETVYLKPNTRTMVGTGVSVKIPQSHVGLLFARTLYRDWETHQVHIVTGKQIGRAHV